MNSTPRSTPPPSSPPPGFFEFVHTSQLELDQLNAQIQDLSHRLEQPPPDFINTASAGETLEPPPSGLPRPESPVTTLGQQWRGQAGKEFANYAVEEVLENSVEDALKGAAKSLVRPSSPPGKKVRQWFYEKEGGTSDPVPEPEILKMLEEGALPWSTLVWHRTLQDWTPAEQTDLAELAGPSTPPPLTRKQPSAVQSQTQSCPACGKPRKEDDRFCPACGERF